MKYKPALTSVDWTKKKSLKPAPQGSVPEKSLFSKTDNSQSQTNFIELLFRRVKVRTEAGFNKFS